MEEVNIVMQRDREKRLSAILSIDRKMNVSLAIYACHQILSCELNRTDI